MVARAGALRNSDSRFDRLRSFTESRIATISPEKRFDRVRSFAEKIVAIQNLPVPAVPREESPPRKSLLAFRVTKCARVQCNYGFEKLQHTEAQVIERQHARAQKMIAENLRQSDPTCRRRRRRRRFRMISIKRSMILSPFMACLRWLSAPLARLARIASLAGSKMDRVSKKSARVSADNSPLLSS